MEKDTKTEVIRMRVDKNTKDEFMTLCKSKCINPSELIRQFIENWMLEQNDSTINKRRKTDLKK